jgi:hypothetical protein
MTAQADRTAPEAAGAGLVTRLGETIASRLRGFVAPGQDFALLDFPDHSNVGDSAIWLGELAAFRALGGGAPGYVATKDAFDAEALRRAVPDGPIFLHGGGNFGDLWPEHQLFRERILAQFPDRAIVQLPQTVHFAAQVARDRAAAAIAAHPRFVLMVRDAASQALAESRFDCAVHPVPDMAFALGAQSGAAAPTVRLLLLLRTDKERAAGLHAAPPALPAGALVRDWLDEPPRLHDRAAWRTRLAAGNCPASSAPGRGNAGWSAWCPRWTRHWRCGRPSQGTPNLGRRRRHDDHRHLHRLHAQPGGAAAAGAGCHRGRGRRQRRAGESGGG